MFKGGILLEKILELKNVNKKIGKKQILHDISFSLNEGEILGFIGPNGAGKTTTIKLILGLQRIDSGEIFINNYNVKTNFKKAIERVGAIVENPDEYMYLTGKQNLKLIARLYPNIKEEKINEVIEFVGLKDRINDKVSKYSLGMRQRLGIAEALINNPNLLVLDEPTNGLDPEGITELRALLIKLAKEQKVAILISSHNLAELQSFCTNICIIQEGKILSSESINELKHETIGKYIIELDKQDDIDRFLKDGDKKLENGFVEVNKAREEISDFVFELLKAGYKIYQVKEKEKTLEEAFLERIGGDNNDESNKK